MSNNENKRMSFLVDTEDQGQSAGQSPDSQRSKLNQLKKPLIFALMGIVFFCCLYLIFNPSKENKKTQVAGLNESVPQATDAGLATDKQKAYEQEQLEKKTQEQRSELASLSDYWNEDSTSESHVPAEEEMKDSFPYGGSATGSRKAALNSYRHAQSALGSFYEDNSEAHELRRQIAELKEKLAKKDQPQSTTVDDQLALMEKSYQMAARYLPSNNSNTGSQPKADTVATPGSSAEQQQFVAVMPTRKSVVSTLYREPTDSAFLSSLGEDRNRGFYTAIAGRQMAHPRNSIRACIQQTQVVSTESDVKLRLLETAKTAAGVIPQGTELTANAKLQGGRLQLKVSAIEWDGAIIPVDITVYDLDGQQGLPLPYSPEMNTLTEIAANMAQTSGTSIMMTRSASQQVAGDLSRGLVQGVSGYFSKKIKTPQITLKAGYEVLLVPKS